MILPDEFSAKVSIPLDEDGYLDRECPNEECSAVFKVFASDWTAIVRDEEVFCPICGHSSPSDTWLTSDQADHCRDKLREVVQPALHSQLQRIAHDFNRRQPRVGFVHMSMKVTMGRTPVATPLEAQELMRRRYQCEECRCRYATIGAAFFCPSCGHNSPVAAFSETIEIVRKLPQVREAIYAALDRDAGADAWRLTLEQHMIKIVGAFQSYAEALADSSRDGATPALRKNLFQNLPQSSDFWERTIGVRYEAMLCSHEWQELQVFFQQRHLLAHREGIVDGEYIRKSGDTRYAKGQRVVIAEDDVHRFAAIVELLASALRTACLHRSPSEGA